MKILRVEVDEKLKHICIESDTYTGIIKALIDIEEKMGTDLSTKCYVDISSNSADEITERRYYLDLWFSNLKDMKKVKKIVKECFKNVMEV